MELEIKDTTETARPASYFDIHIETDSEGQVRMKLYDKTHDFNFLIVKVPLICSNIPVAPADGSYISQYMQ